MKLQDGYTLMHEHMTMDLTPGDLGTDSFELLCRDLKELYNFGVRNIVDLTNQSMGRDPEYLKRLTEETGIQMIPSTGYYLERYIGPYVENRSVEELADESIRDLTVGIGESGLKAGIIGEIAWSHEGAGKLEQKAWKAMYIAARQTGAIVSTHPSRGIQQLPQAEYLLSAGIAPEKIVIGHVEFNAEEDALKTILKKGVYIGLDMIGKKVHMTDEERADFACRIRDWGYLQQLFLSLDICRREDLRSAGSYGYVHLFDTFIPMLKERGFCQQDIDLVLKQNPERIFGS